MTDTTPPAGDTTIDLGSTPTLPEFLQRLSDTLNVLRGSPDAQVAKFQSLNLLLPDARQDALRPYVNAEGRMEVCEYRTQFVAEDNPVEVDALLRFLHDTFTLACAEQPTASSHIAAMSILYTSRLNQQDDHYGFVGILDWHTPVQPSVPQGVIGDGEEPL